MVLHDNHCINGDMQECVPIMNVAVSDGLGLDLPRTGRLGTR